MNLHCDLSPFAPVSWEMPGCPQTGCRARGGHKPVAEQDIMMRNNLRGREPIPIPGAMGILDQGDLILQATGLPARRIDAQFGLNACNDELINPVSAQVLLQLCLVKRVRHLLLYNDVAFQGCDGGMDLR